MASPACPAGTPSHRPHYCITTRPQASKKSPVIKKKKKKCGARPQQGRAHNYLDDFFFSLGENDNDLLIEPALLLHELCQLYLPALRRNNIGEQKSLWRFLVLY